MKRQKLLESNSLPDFHTAVNITLSIILFSLIISFFISKIPSGPSDTLIITLLGLFSYSFVTGLLLWIVFKKYPSYILSLLKHPFDFLKGLSYYLMFIPVLFTATAIFMYLFKIAGFTPVPQEIIFIYLRTDSFYLLSIMFFLSCIVAPFAEEVIFRGIVYAGLKDRFSTRLSMILSSLIFALLHNEIFVLPSLFIFGIFLSYLFEKYQNIWLSISVHFFNNFFTTIFVLIVKYLGDKYMLL